jgi:hypothetical protein
MLDRSEDFFLAAVVIHYGRIGLSSYLASLLLGAQLVLVRIFAVVLVVAGIAPARTTAERIPTVNDFEERL